MFIINETDKLSNNTIYYFKHKKNLNIIINYGLISKTHKVRNSQNVHKRF